MTHSAAFVGHSDGMTTDRPTPAELGAQLADTWTKPLTEEQIEAAARIFVSVIREREAQQ